MTKEGAVTIRLYYFQGPADEIALRLFWRHDSAGESYSVLTPENFELPDGLENPCN